MQPTRKNIRLKHYEYSTPGAYFITLCTANKAALFWDRIAVGADSIRPPIISLSPIGKTAEQAILQIPQHYHAVCVDTYCIMPDHIHILLRIRTDENGRMLSAPTISTVVGSMKRWVSRKIGRPIWQKSFYEHIIRCDEDHHAIWEYIENNPLKYIMKIQHNP